MSNLNVEEKKSNNWANEYPRKWKWSKQERSMRPESVLIDVIVLCVLVDLFCAVSALLLQTENSDD
jgi:hypothetical protein